jgi:AcrR family transcriptional regulator
MSVEADHRRDRKRRSDGERSRNAILREAARLATIEGIGGISIARLADAVGMSKSGLFAHFGSKQELQLATIETAETLFDELVIKPALAAPTGLERTQQLAELFLRHVEASTYPGGCFFASVAAELDTQPGPVRDSAISFEARWLALIENEIRVAQAEGAIDRAEDAEQLAFELNAYLLMANFLFVVNQEPTPINRARHALTRRLAAAAPATSEAPAPPPPPP